MEEEIRKSELLKPGERVDDLQNGYYVIQDPQKFCFGMDAVLLSGFAKIKKGETVLDLGTGTGVIPILLHARSERAGILQKSTSGFDAAGSSAEKGKGFGTADLQTGRTPFTGLEIQPECAEMARRSVAWNHLEESVSIVQGDIKEAADLFGAASFSVVTCNPPYMIGQHGLQNPELPKAIARHEILCTFEDVARETAKLLKDRGRFYLVHRPFRLTEIMLTLTKYKLEPKRMQLVYPYVDREPNMVLIEAMKGGNSRITVERPLIVYEKPGVYTESILQIYGKP